MNNSHTIPCNRIAARIISPGVHYNIVIKEKSHRDFPTKIKNLKVFENQLEFRDFTGHKHGRFTIVGLSTESGNNTRTKWVARCSCGQYENRCTKSLKKHLTNKDLEEDMCYQCRDLEKIKLKSKAISLGLSLEQYCEKYLFNQKGKNK